MSAIGIFDSGIGGLTVLKALKEALPGESFHYLGDTARLPYGSKSPESIRRYLHQNLSFLKGLGVKAVVVACNSASTVLDQEFWNGIPVYGVIEPGARRAAELTRSGRVGVLGTRATVESQAYLKALLTLDPGIAPLQQACPLLVPLVEEGWIYDDVTRQILARYLQPLLAAQIDTLILGCTHYPVLKAMIAEIMGDKVCLVDSARVIADQLSRDLDSGKIPAAGKGNGTKIWATDLCETFQTVGHRILGPFTIDEWHLADLK